VKPLKSVVLSNLWGMELWASDNTINLVNFFYCPAYLPMLSLLPAFIYLFNSLIIGITLPLLGFIIAGGALWLCMRFQVTLPLRQENTRWPHFYTNHVCWCNLLDPDLMEVRLASRKGNQTYLWGTPGLNTSGTVWWKFTPPAGGLSGGGTRKHA